MQILQKDFMQRSFGLSSSPARTTLEKDMAQLPQQLDAAVVLPHSAAQNPAMPPDVPAEPFMGDLQSIQAYKNSRNWDVSRDGPVLAGLEKLEKHYTVRKIAGDGHCLFRAVAAGMLYHAKRGGKIPAAFEAFLNKKPTIEEVITAHSDEMVLMLRTMCAQNITTNDVACGYANDYCGSVDAYKKRIVVMKDDILEGDSTEIELLQVALGVSIHVLHVQGIGQGQDMKAEHLNPRGNDISLLHRPGHYDLLFAVP
jgi:hypothetical protein